MSSITVKKEVTRGEGYWMAKRTFQILDCRSEAKGDFAGRNWSVVCKEHGLNGEVVNDFYTYSEALAFARNEATCSDCDRERAEKENQETLRRMARQQAETLLTLNHADFTWANEGCYSGGRNGGATKVAIRYGISTGNGFYDHVGIRAVGEMEARMDAQGNVVMNYVIENWNPETRETTYADFSDVEEFKAVLKAKLAERINEFKDGQYEWLTKTIREARELTDAETFNAMVNVELERQAQMAGINLKAGA